MPDETGSCRNHHSYFAIHHNNGNSSYYQLTSMSQKGLQQQVIAGIIVPVSSRKDFIGGWYLENIADKRNNT